MERCRAGLGAQPFVRFRLLPSLPSSDPADRAADRHGVADEGNGLKRAVRVNPLSCLPQRASAGDGSVGEARQTRNSWGDGCYLSWAKPPTGEPRTASLSQAPYRGVRISSRARKIASGVQGTQLAERVAKLVGAGVACPDVRATNRAFSSDGSSSRSEGTGNIRPDPIHRPAPATAGSWRGGRSGRFGAPADGPSSAADRRAAGGCLPNGGPAAIPPAMDPAARRWPLPHAPAMRSAVSR